MASKGAKGAAAPAKQNNDWVVMEEEYNNNNKSSSNNKKNGAKDARQLQQEAGDLNDETSRSIQRSLATVAQTQQVGAETMVALDRQGKQIEHMERDLETIEDNQKQSERHLRGLKSVFGSIANKFSKNKGAKHSYREESEVQPRQTTSSAQQAKNGSAVIAKNGADKKSSGGGVSSADLLQGEDEHTERLRQQMREQDEGLDQLSAALGNLGAMAEDMNREINDQNTRLQTVSAKVETQNRTIEKNNRQIKKML